MRSTLLCVSTVCAAVFFASTASADTLLATFDLPAQTGAPGDKLTFSGTIMNNSGMDLFVNSAEINLFGFGPNDSDLTDFIFNFTGLLPDTSSIGPADFFTVTIPNPMTAGLYPGTLIIQGGADDAADSTLATVDFSVNVTGTTAPSAPEPGTLAITLASLAAVWFRQRSRDSHGADARYSEPGLVPARPD